MTESENRHNREQLLKQIDPVKYRHEFLKTRAPIRWGCFPVYK